MSNDRLELNDTDLARPGFLEVDALLDGEQSDVHMVRAVLDDPEARDYLVEALMLRQLARRPGQGDTATEAAVPAGSRRRSRLVAMAAMLALAAGLGYVARDRLSEAEPSRGYVELVLDDSPRAAPAATRSIRFEPGLNWTSGGERR